MVRRLSLGLAIAVVVGAVLVPSLSAAAATCQSGGDYSIDCTWPDSTGCDGANSTPRSTFVAGLGTLELRYDSGCRSIWGRAPQAADEDVWVQRTSCLAGNTLGLNTQNSGALVYSKQLNDKNCTGQAAVLWNGTGYFTGSY